jgi:hypothetical protein
MERTIGRLIHHEKSNKLIFESGKADAFERTPIEAKSRTIDA